MKKNKQLYCLFLAVLLTLSLALGGCSGRSPQNGAIGQTGESYQEGGAAKLPRDQYDEELLKTQTEFDQFTERVFLDEVQNSLIDLHYKIKDPAAFGITIPPATYGDFSVGQMCSDFQDMKDLKSELEAFNTDFLTKEQLVTYRTLMDYLDTELLSEGMELYYQPLAPTIGIQAQLPILLAEYQFYTRQDADLYLDLLSQIDVYYGQIMEFEKQKVAAGLGPSDTSIDSVIQSCNSYLVRPETNFLTDTFKERLDGLPDLTDADKEEYMAKHTQILKEHFIPAYQLLVDGLTALKGSGRNEYGLSYFEHGKEYYDYLVKSSTGTSYSMEELKDAILVQQGKDLSRMSQILQENPDLYSKIDSYAFNLTEPAEILDDLKSQLSKDFPQLPASDYTVKYVPEALESTLSPAFYLVPPIDQYQDNTIYINGGDDFQNDDLYTTLAHEGYPGHLYQNVYFLNNTSCHLRHILSCGGYSEGWATYVENYSYTLDNGLDKNLAEILACNQSVTLSIYALLDINIHYEGWDLEKTKEYLGRFYSLEDEEVIRNVYYAILDNPSNYLEYYTGYLEILNMRDEAMDTLGKDFELKRFHKFILDMGITSFRVIRPYFKVWLMTYNGIQK